MHSSKSAWLPDTLSSREYLQEKYLWMSLAKHGCTSCTMFSHKLSYVNKRQAIEGSSRMRSKGSYFTLGVWGLRVFSPDVVQPFATGLHLFFFRPPRPPLLQDPFPCHCCTKFHGNSHGYCDAHRLARFYHNAFSRCHLVPWIQTDFLSWFAYVVMQHSSFERA